MYSSCVFELSDYLRFNGGVDNEFSYCGEEQGLLAIETCTNKLNITLFSGQADDSYRGASIYYEGLNN